MPLGDSLQFVDIGTGEGVGHLAPQVLRRMQARKYVPQNIKIAGPKERSIQLAAIVCWDMRQGKKDAQAYRATKKKCRWPMRVGSFTIRRKQSDTTRRQQWQICGGDAL